MRALEIRPLSGRGTCLVQTTGKGPWKMYDEGLACKASEVVDAHFVVQLEHAAQALHPPSVPVLLVCLRCTALNLQPADSATRDQDQPSPACWYQPPEAGVHWHLIAQPQG